MRFIVVVGMLIVIVAVAWVALRSDGTVQQLEAPRETPRETGAMPRDETVEVEGKTVARPAGAAHGPTEKTLASNASPRADGGTEEETARRVRNFSVELLDGDRRRPMPGHGRIEGRVLSRETETFEGGWRVRLRVQGEAHTAIMWAGVGTNGSFFQYVPPGVVSLTAVPPGYPRSLPPDAASKLADPATSPVVLGSASVTIRAGETRRVELRLPTLSRLLGRVVDHLGSAVPGVTVVTDIYATRITDADGRFALLAPAGARVRVQTVGTGIYGASTPQMATPERFVTIVVPMAAAIGGTLTDQRTKRPAPHATVVARQRGGGVSEPASVDRDGAFELSGLAPGMYDLIATTSFGRFGFRAGVQAIAGRRTHAAFQVELGGRIEVLTDPPKTAASGRRITIVWLGHVIADEVVHESSHPFVVPVGHFEVRLHAKDGRVRATRVVSIPREKLARVSFRGEKIEQ